MQSIVFNGKIGLDILCAKNIEKFVNAILVKNVAFGNSKYITIMKLSYKVFFTIPQR